MEEGQCETCKFYMECYFPDKEEPSESFTFGLKFFTINCLRNSYSNYKKKEESDV